MNAQTWPAELCADCSYRTRPPKDPACEILSEPVPRIGQTACVFFNPRPSFLRRQHPRGPPLEAIAARGYVELEPRHETQKDPTP